MQTALTDNQIIATVLQGRQQAFAELVTRYQNFVFTICLRYTNSREDAEDFAQESFVKAYRSLANFRGDAKFSTWLYSVVNSVCIGFLRKKKLNMSSLDDERVFDAAEAIDMVDGRQEERHCRLVKLNSTLQLLSTGDAQLISMFYTKELSLEEMGQTLNLHANTVKVRLHRARTRLKDKMKTQLADGCSC